MTDSNNNYDIYKLYELMDKLTGCAAIFDDEESADCLEDDICEHEDGMDYTIFCDDRCCYRQLKDAILRGDKLDVYAALWTPTEEEIKAHKASGGGDDGYLGHAVDTPEQYKELALKAVEDFWSTEK